MYKTCLYILLSSADLLKKALVYHNQGIFEGKNLDLSASKNVLFFLAKDLREFTVNSNSKIVRFITVKYLNCIFVIKFCWHIRHHGQMIKIIAVQH